MSLQQSLGFDALPDADIVEWAIVTQTDWTAVLNQGGYKHQVKLVPLTDGRYICNANLITEETGLLADVLVNLPTAEVKAVPLKACRALVNAPTDAEFGNNWPQWEQILGAGLGPQGAEDGWPLGAHVMHNGIEWESTIDGNIWEPGVSGWREVVQTGYPAWIQPTGSHDAYQTGELVTHDNPNDGGIIWVYRSKIDANTTEPGRDGTFDRWWEPVSRESDYTA